MSTIAFFNNKGGVGKTSLVYHLTWMFADQGLSVLAVDLDPQANLSTMFLDEDRLEEYWTETSGAQTVLGPVQPLLQGEGGIGEPHIERVDDIGLLVGDLALSGFEDELSQQWPSCLDGKRRAFHVIGAFYEVIRQAANTHEADLVLMDVGPNLGAINRAALIAADHVVVPLGADLFSLKGLQNLGPTLADWRRGWHERLKKAPPDMAMPAGTMEIIGYIIMKHSVRFDRPVKAFDKWIARIPDTYGVSVLEEPVAPGMTTDDDPHCLATLKDYRSLMPLAQEARKPMFHLKPADGAIGAHVKAVQQCYWDFKTLACCILERTDAALRIK